MAMPILFAAAEKTVALPVWAEMGVIGGVVTLAVAYVGYQTWKTLFAKQADGGCGSGCHGCSQNKSGDAVPLKLVMIEGVKKAS